jgi:hypothetical protein
MQKAQLMSPSILSVNSRLESLSKSLTDIKLRPQERIIAWRLTEERLLAATELVNALYGHRTDGGPLTARRIVCLHICQLRKKVPVQIHREGFRGWYVSAADIGPLRDFLADELKRAA